MSHLFEADDLREALHELARRLDAQGTQASIHVIGGAALALAYYERSATMDVDARVGSNPAAEASVLAMVEIMASERGWPSGWLNTKAAPFIPFAGANEWKQICQVGTVVVYVASAPPLLAMKLKAGRNGRDEEDINFLLGACGIASEADAIEIFETHYPGEVMRESASLMVRFWLEQRADRTKENL